MLLLGGPFSLVSVAVFFRKKCMYIKKRVVASLPFSVSLMLLKTHFQNYRGFCSSL